MSINPKCCMCENELHEFGAILLSPPVKDIVRKYHICNECFFKMQINLRITDYGNDITDGWYVSTKSFQVCSTLEYFQHDIFKCEYDSLIKIEKYYKNGNTSIKIDKDSEFIIVDIICFRKDIECHIRKLTPDELTIKDIIE